MRSSQPLWSEDEIKIQAAIVGRRACPRDPSGNPQAYSSDEKIRIVLEGLRGEYSLAELCRREGMVLAAAARENSCRHQACVERGVLRLMWEKFR